MDIDSLTSQGQDKPIDCVILDREYKETDIVIKILGTESTAYQKAVKRSQREFMLKLKEVADKIDVEQLQVQEDIEKAVAITVGWSEISRSGEPLEFNEDNARKLYADAPFVRLQVLNKAADHEAFSRG